MLNYSIYTYIIKPAGVLRVLLSILCIIAAVSLWGATNLDSWLARAKPFLLWGVPATLNWMALVAISGLLIRFSPKVHAYLTATPLRALLCYRVWPAVLGTLCAGLFAGIGLVYHASPDQIVLFNSPWNWSAALWGFIISFVIIEWFNLYTKGQDPANIQAKLLELQARIRPHFLFNSLNSAMALIRLDPEAAEHVLENLSVLFREALESDESSETSLQKELDLARNYLSIETIRLGERLQIQWKLDKDTLNLTLPRLTLQPLLENAVRHGIEPLSSQGVIQVKSSNRLGKLVISVSNTMPKPSPTNATKGHGMALNNLRARISLLYDFEGGLHTKVKQDSQQQYWFTSTFTIPAAPYHGLNKPKKRAK